MRATITNDFERRDTFYSRASASGTDVPEMQLSARDHYLSFIFAALLFLSEILNYLKRRKSDLRYCHLVLVNGEPIVLNIALKKIY